MSKPTLCLDFDGVLHSYASGWQGAGVVADPPVPGAVRFLRQAVEKFTVVVYSSRSSSVAGTRAMRLALYKWVAADDPNTAPDLFNQIQFASEKPAAFLTIDDRAVCFDGTWPDVDELLAFKAWNKGAKPNWVVRASKVASYVEVVILEAYPGLTPNRDESGLTAQHLLFMAVELVEMRLTSETRACRWLGWLQAGAVALGVTTLEDMKEANLASGDRTT